MSIIHLKVVLFAILPTLLSCGAEDHTYVSLSKRYTEESLGLFFKEPMSASLIQAIRDQEPSHLFTGREWRAWLRGNLGQLQFVNVEDKKMLGRATGATAYLTYKSNLLREAQRVFFSNFGSSDQRWKLFHKLAEKEKTEQIGAAFVKVSDPKNGFVQITDKLAHYVSNFSDSERITFTLSVLVHEARHFGGYGVHYGLPHAICPKELVEAEFQGVPACDDNLGGPYGVQVSFLGYLLHAWKQGEEQELFSRQAKERAEVMYIHYLARILNTEERTLHKPERLEDHLKVALEL